jgi:hypothetical protein
LDLNPRRRTLNSRPNETDFDGKYWPTNKPPKNIARNGRWQLTLLIGRASNFLVTGRGHTGRPAMRFWKSGGVEAAMRAKNPAKPLLAAIYHAVQNIKGTKADIWLSCDSGSDIEVVGLQPESRTSEPISAGAAG